MTAIYVVGHKKSRVPNNGIYKPIQVGYDKDNYLGYIRDNTGNNIAYKNKNYCELTALYWIWKNDNSDIVGLMHYRRLLGKKRGIFSPINKKYKLIIDEEDIVQNIQKYDLILPKSHNYLTETARQHYIHNHYSEGLDMTRKVLAEKYPKYLDAFDKVMESKKNHLLNIIICRKKMLDRYCVWLFDILFEVESRIDLSNYSVNESRVFGYIGELMIDVFISYNKLSYIEYPVLYMEKQNWINHYWTSLKGKLGLINVE